jgi:hypothetical protein
VARAQSDEANTHAQRPPWHGPLQRQRQAGGPGRGEGAPRARVKCGGEVRSSSAGNGSMQAQRGPGGGASQGAHAHQARQRNARVASPPARCAAKWPQRWNAVAREGGSAQLLHDRAAPGWPDATGAVSSWRGREEMGGGAGWGAAGGGSEGGMRWPGKGALLNCPMTGLRPAGRTPQVQSQAGGAGRRWGAARDGAPRAGGWWTRGAWQGPEGRRRWRAAGMGKGEGTARSSGSHGARPGGGGSSRARAREGPAGGARAHRPTSVKCSQTPRKAGGDGGGRAGPGRKAPPKK